MILILLTGIVQRYEIRVVNYDKISSVHAINIYPTIYSDGRDYKFLNRNSGVCRIDDSIVAVF